MTQQESSRPTAGASMEAASDATTSSSSDDRPGKISVTVAPFTGGPFLVEVTPSDTVEELKKAVAKRLKVLKDRICLLYRDSQLSEGSMEENCVVDGSRITLLPKAETGLLAQRPEQSVMQALESLSDSQVVDFLSGKAPLNLTMRLGDHMMLIQLQLSTVNSSSSSKRSKTSASSSPSAATTTTRTTSTTTISPPPTNPPVSSPEVSPASSSTASTASEAASSSSYKPKLDTRALTEASKNLTQTLKQLSSEVLTSKCEEQQQATRSSSSTSSSTSSTKSSSGGSSSERPRKRGRTSSSTTGGGAIIESMHHHGKGVYSGTFSGTLNPALQDCNGQPRCDITTIIHILNDLLCAQYKNYQCQGASAKKPTAQATAQSTAQPTAQPTASQQQPQGQQEHGLQAQQQGQPQKQQQHQQQQQHGQQQGQQGSSTLRSGTNHHPNHFHHHHHHHHHLHQHQHHQHQHYHQQQQQQQQQQQCSSVGDQLQVTREKMEQLRRIMDERKARRRARREARAAPYSTSWSLKSSLGHELTGAAENVTGDSPTACQTQQTHQQPTSVSSAGIEPTSGQAPSPGPANKPSDNMFNNNPELELVTA